MRADQVLATINGQPIQLKDLVSLGPDETEKTMAEEQYRSLKGSVPSFYNFSP